MTAVARTSFLTATKKNTEICRETVSILSSVEHTQRIVSAVVLTLSCCFYSNYFLHYVTFITVASYIRAASAARRSTDTFLTGCFVRNAGKKEAVKL